GEQIDDVLEVAPGPEGEVVDQGRVGLRPRAVAGPIALPEATEFVPALGLARLLDQFNVVQAERSGRPAPRGIFAGGLAEHLAMDYVQLRLAVLDGGGDALDALAGHRHVPAGLVSLESPFLPPSWRKNPAQEDADASARWTHLRVRP